MGLTRLAIKRPVTMIMIILVLVIAGLISYTRLPVQEMPNVSYPFVAVISNFPGATPEDMLQTVTQPIENAVSGVDGVSQMNGISSDGRSLVLLQFDLGVNVNTAADDVGQALERVAGQLPQGMQPPTIFKANPNAAPIMNVAVSGGLNQGQLYNLADNVLQPDLQQVLGVASVGIQGGLVPQVNVTVNPAKLAGYGLSLTTVDNAIAAQNVSIGGGNTTNGNLTSTAQTSAYYQTAQQMQNLVVANRPGGNILLSQVADVQQGYAPVDQQTLYDGKPAVGLTISAQSGVNIVQVDRAIKAEMARLKPALPTGVQMHIVNDQTVYTYASIQAVENDLALAVLLPMIILLLFLHRPRNMLIVMLAIPTSLISTFTLMYALGFSIDLISLLALSLMTGILVDDSIVVLENINRHLSMGKSPVQAAIDGRTEIGQAAIAITLTDVVVYAPIAFTSGLVGQIFQEFGLTIVIATLFSLFISFTLTPMLASRWLKDPLDEEALANASGRMGPWTRFSSAWERGYSRLRAFYGRVIASALKHRPTVVLVAVAALALTVAFIPLGWVGTEFVPQEDNGQFSVNVTLPVGTAQPVTEGVVDKLDQEIRAIPGVADSYATAGARGGFFGGSTTNTGSIDVDLVPINERPPLTSYLAKVRRLSRQFPGAQIITMVQNPLRIGGQRAIGVVLQGADINTLNTLAQRVQVAIQGLPGIVEVQNTAAQATPELSVEINRQQAAYFGISAATIGNTVSTAIGGSTVSYLRPNGSTNETPIVVYVRGSSTMTPQQIENLPLSVPSGSPAATASNPFGAGSIVPPQVITLGQVASVVPDTEPASISDQNRVLEDVVMAGQSGSVPLGTLATEITQAVNKLGLPPGYSWSFSGSVQQQQQVFAPLYEAFALSVLLVYMLTSALYESLLYPLAVLFSLPLATVGALAALAVTGNTLNLYSFMGMIMLMGLVAKNAILLVDYTNRLRAEGVDRVKALIEAGRTRLRPILMTTLTMIFAMLPLALKFGAGSEERSPMATVLIGGLLTSTLLTLIFVPVMYTFLDDFGAWLARRRQPSRRAATAVGGEFSPAAED